MLVAICGKGGTGKTAFTVMMTKVLLEANTAGKLLLIDADPAMGLPNALGIEVRQTIGRIREEIIQTAKRGNEGERMQVVDMVDYMVFKALHETDRFALLSMGRSETLGCFCPVNDLLRQTIEALSKSFDTMIVDCEAGLEQISRQVIRHVDVLIVISDATSRGIQTGALIKKMVEDEKVIKCKKMGLVFNRVQGDQERLNQYAQDIGVEVFGFIPHDENIAHYDLISKPLLELPRTSPGLIAVHKIVKHLIPNVISAVHPLCRKILA